MTGLLIAAALLMQQPAPVSPAVADFEARVAAYMKLHNDAAGDLGALSPTKSSKLIEEKRNSIAEGVRANRSAAAQGDVFTPAIAAEFRTMIAANLKKRPKRIRESIRSGEQVMAKLHVNGSYPEGMPLETMPPSLLIAFPKLPSELDYRFVGATLVLRDVTANLIIDLLPNAIALP